MTKCLHEHFNSYGMVGRHSPTEGGPIAAFTVSFRLECAECKESFYFGNYHRFKDGSRQEVEFPCAPGSAPMEAPWVPGQFECPKCMFRLSNTLLNASTGGVAPDRSMKDQVCPNDGETMKRVTWQQLANDCSDAVSRFAKRARQLEDAWPEGYEMPVDQGE